MDTEATRTSRFHRIFQAGVAIKGIHGIIELVGAVSIYIGSGATIYAIATSIVTEELVEDPNDFLANFVLQHAHITASGKDFAALYLFVSAVVNIILAVGLFLHRKHMFPVAKILLGFFALYQLYLFIQTHSPWLLAGAIFDAVIIGLIFSEYRRHWPTTSPSSPV